MPRGRDAPALRRLMTELQMLLHEHPVNVAARPSRAAGDQCDLGSWGGEIARRERYALPAGFRRRSVSARVSIDCTTVAVTRRPRMHGAARAAGLAGRSQSSLADDVDVLEAAVARTAESRIAERHDREAGDVIDGWRRHGRARRDVQVLASAARAGGVGRMLSRTIRRREPAADGEALPAICIRCCDVCMRLAACELASDLDLGLARLIPVSQLGGIDAAVELLCEHFRRGSRIVVVGDFDADGATSTALVVRQLRAPRLRERRLPGAESLPVRLRPDAGDRALAAQGKPELIVTVDNGISSHAGVAEARALGIETLITDHHLAPPTLPAANAHRQSQRAGRCVSEQGARGCRRRVLSDGGADARDASARSACECRRRWRICSIWSRSARSRISCRSIATIACWCIRGCDAFVPAAASPAFVPCWKRRIACRPQCRGRRSRLSGRTALECGRPARRHVDRHSMLADRRSEHGAHAGGAADAVEPRSRELELQMQQEALMAIADMRAEDPELPLGLCLFDESWHQGVVGSRRFAREGSRASSGDRAGARRRSYVEGLGALGVGRAHSRRARRHRDSSSRLDRKVRRPCDGGGAHVAGRRARGIPRCVRRRSASLDDASMTRSASCTPTARCSGAS